jgi:hypothetical protein
VWTLLEIFDECFHSLTVIFKIRYTSIPTIATLIQVERNGILWPTRGTCSLNTDDVVLVDGGLQRREGCRRARGTPCILGGNIAIQEDTWYMQEGSAVGGKKPLRREPGSHSKRRCPFRGRGYPSDICVRCPARNIVDPMQGVLTTVPNRTYHLISSYIFPGR